jgi:hypothetical protein
VPENKAKLLFNNLDQIIEVSTDLLQTMFDKIPDGFDSFALVGNIFVQFVSSTLITLHSHILTIFRSLDSMYSMNMRNHIIKPLKRSVY